MAKSTTARKPKTAPAKTAKAKSENASASDIPLDTLVGEVSDADILATLDAEATSTSGDLISPDAVETVDKKKIYEAQDAGTTIAGEPSAAETRKRAGRAKRELDMDAVKTVFGSATIVGKIDDLPVKVQSKARNAIGAATSGVRLSQYTRYAMESLLNAEDQTITATQLRDILTGRGYTPGTASAQAQQQMTLLPFLGAATRTGNSIKVADTDLIEKMLEVPASA